MSQGVGYLHSHSAIEREKRLPKHTVLVDEEYESMFKSPQAFVYSNRLYFQVPILEFVKKGGVFKNFDM
jgi:hypothetical protein